MSLKYLFFTLFALLFGACAAPAGPVPQEIPSSSGPPASSAPGPKDYPIRIQPGEETFTSAPLPAEVREWITGVSWKENEHIQLDDLSLLTLSYIGFDDNHYTGQMVVAAEVADDLTGIFKELYEHRYPIEKMQLIDVYGADDNAAMAANNSSAFCYREIDGTSYLSNHSFGRAVDLNPVQNPYVRGELVQPEDSVEYLEREDVRKGMITRGDACYNAFIARGWEWGGDWTGPIDYQHFEKP